MTIKFINHTADIQFEISSRKLEKLFFYCSLALKKSITKNKIKSKIKKQIKIKERNLENLLYNYLEEFLIMFDSENFILSKVKNIKIDLEKFILTADIYGDNSEDYEFYSHIKAITYNEMKIEKNGSKWKCIITFDV